MTIKDAAKILGRSYSTIRNRMLDGSIRFVRPFGKGTRYPVKEDILLQLEPRTNSTTDDYVKDAIEFRKRNKQAIQLLKKHGIILDRKE